jgi:hypothetical protein
VWGTEKAAERWIVKNPREAYRDVIRVSQHHAGSGHGIGKWEKSDVIELLKTGTTPEQSKVKGAMRETIQDGLKYLNDADLEAIADYLFAPPPIVHDVTPKR